MHMRGRMAQPDKKINYGNKAHHSALNARHVRSRRLSIDLRFHTAQIASPVPEYYHKLSEAIVTKPDFTR